MRILPKGFLPFSVCIDDLAQHLNICPLGLVALQQLTYWMQGVGVGGRVCDTLGFVTKALNAWVIANLRPKLWRLVPRIVAEADLSHEFRYNASFRWL